MNLKHDFVAALDRAPTPRITRELEVDPFVAAYEASRSDCAHELVEVLSVNGRNLDNAVRMCAACHTVIGELTEAQVQSIFWRAHRAQDVDLVVACEDALATIQTSSSARHHRKRVAELLAKAYAKKWGSR